MRVSNSWGYLFCVFLRSVHEKEVEISHKSFQWKFGSSWSESSVRSGETFHLNQSKSRIRIRGKVEKQRNVVCFICSFISLLSCCLFLSSKSVYVSYVEFILTNSLALDTILDKFGTKHLFLCLNHSLLHDNNIRLGFSREILFFEWKISSEILFCWRCVCSILRVFAKFIMEIICVCALWWSGKLFTPIENCFAQNEVLDRETGWSLMEFTKKSFHWIRNSRRVATAQLV